MSKMRPDPYKVVGQVVSALEDGLGHPYRLIRRPRNERWLDLREAPDLVVLDEESGQLTLIEFRVAPPDDDLPFATISEVLRLKEYNAALNPRVVLVSIAFLSPVIEQALTAEDVGVIRGWTCDEVMPALREFIAAGSVAHR